MKQKPSSRLDPVTLQAAARAVLRNDPQQQRSAAFSPNGERVITASDDHTARIGNVDGTGNPILLAGHTGSVRSVAFSPDGKRVITASDDNTARLWNADGSGNSIILAGHTVRWGPPPLARMASASSPLQTTTQHGYGIPRMGL